MRWGARLFIFCAFVVIKAYCTGCPKESGYCVTSSNRDINTGVYKLNSVNPKTSALKAECLRKCLAYDRSTGCEVIWDQWNQGCYIHTSTTVSKGSRHEKHSCWVFKRCKNTCTRCSVYGYCRRSKCVCKEGYQGDGYICKKIKEYNACYKRITELDAYIKYPKSGRYRYYQYCSWEISVSEPIIFQFKKFDLMYGCTKDSLTLQYNNGSATSLKKFGCNEKKPPPDYIPPDWRTGFELTFKSNHKTYKTGFGVYIKKLTCATIGCHPLATCHTSPLSDNVTCSCNPNHWGDGRLFCQAHDNCSLNGVFCDLTSALCRQRKMNKTSTLYSCLCRSGWTGNGTHCTPKPRKSKNSGGGYFGMVIGIIVCGCFVMGHRRPRPANRNATQAAATHVPSPRPASSPQPERSHTPPPPGGGTPPLPTLQRSESLPTISAPKPRKSKNSLGGYFGMVIGIIVCGCCVMPRECGCPASRNATQAAATNVPSPRPASSPQPERSQTPPPPAGTPPLPLLQRSSSLPSISAPKPRKSKNSGGGYFGMVIGIILCGCCVMPRECGCPASRNATQAAATNVPSPRPASSPQPERSQTPPLPGGTPPLPLLQRSSSLPTISALKSRKSGSDGSGYVGLVFGIIVFGCFVVHRRRPRPASGNATQCVVAHVPSPQLERSQTPPPPARTPPLPTLQRSESLPTISVRSSYGSDAPDVPDGPKPEPSDLTTLNDPPPAYHMFYINHGAEPDDMPPPPSYEEAISRM